MNSQNNLQKYQRAVEQGKALVGEIKCKQAELARLAVSVCEIRHGGISNGVYTLKQFSLDIGMNPKTLQDYVAIYRSVVQVVGLNPKKITPEEWRAASKVKRKIDFENTTTRRAEGNLSRKVGAVKREPEEIKKEFKAHLSGEATVGHRLYNWNSELIFIANGLPKMDREELAKNKKVLSEMLMNTMFIRQQLDTILSDMQKAKSA